MAITEDNLLKFKQKLEEKHTFPQETSLLYQYEHEIAKAYLLNLFKPYRNDSLLVKEAPSEAMTSATMLNPDSIKWDIPLIASRINHFLWVRSAIFKEGNSPVNNALKLLPANVPPVEYLNRKVRFETERRLMQDMLERIFADHSTLVEPPAILMVDLDLDKVPLFYEMTEDPKTSILKLDKHTLVGARFSMPSNNDYKLIHHACVEGNSALVKQLLSLGANVNATVGAQQYSPLQLAVLFNRTKVVRILLDAPDIKPNYAKENGGKSALSLAIANGFKDVALILLAHPKVESQESHLKKMMECGWVEAGKIVADKANTPLMKAVIENNLDEVKKLIASLPCKTNEFDKCLLKAVSLGYADISILLIQQGADVNCHDVSNRMTPLHYAITKRLSSVVDLLLEKEAFIYAVSTSEESSMSLAIEHKFAVEKLMAHSSFDTTKPIYMKHEKRYAFIAQIAEERNLPGIKQALNKKKIDKNSENAEITSLKAENEQLKERLSLKQ